MIGMLLGELTPAETRDFGASASSKLVFAELYTVGRTLSAVYRTQQLCDMAVSGSLLFLDASAGSHIHSRDGGVRDFWLECSACKTWRVVENEVFHANKEVGKVWHCPGGCGEPPGEVERQLL